MFFYKLRSWPASDPFLPFPENRKPSVTLLSIPEQRGKEARYMMEGSHFDASYPLRPCHKHQPHPTQSDGQFSFDLIVVFFQKHLRWKRWPGLGAALKGCANVRHVVGGGSLPSVACSSSFSTHCSTGESLTLARQTTTNKFPTPLLCRTPIKSYLNWGLRVFLDRKHLPFKTGQRD